VTPIRPEKDQALLFLRQNAPQYLKMFRELQTPEGWQSFSEGVAETSKRMEGKTGTSGSMLPACRTAFRCNGMRGLQGKVGDRSSPDIMINSMHSFSSSLLKWMDYDHPLYPVPPRPGFLSRPAYAAIFLLMAFDALSSMRR
jgi:hypothetical protein